MGRDVLDNRMKSAFIVLTLLAASSCGYLPFIDYFLLADFSPKLYREIKTKDTVSYILNTDSLRVSITAKAWLPNKRRSERLNFFWSDIDFKVSSESQFMDNLVIDLKKSEVLLIKNNIVIKGKVSIAPHGDSTTHLILYLNPNGYQNKIHVEFGYDKNEKQVLESHQVKVNLRRVMVGNEYLELSPIILELN
ncbi:MAG: hypothetical protein N2044_11510 [Cyclobacteriaceae bacterium]|nr:hypothetical protein [Cyclobacteriaceae bacterium]